MLWRTKIRERLDDSDAILGRNLENRSTAVVNQIEFTRKHPARMNSCWVRR